MNTLYLITGPAGVGKSTISKKLSESIDKSVLIEGDDIYNQFITGHISPWKEGAPIDLFWNNCFCLIKNYLEEGYNVVFNYIINKERLRPLIKEFDNYTIKFVCLMVDKETLLKRDKERDIDCQMGNRCLELRESFVNQNYDEKYIINNSNEVSYVVDDITKNDKYIVEPFKIDDISTPEDILSFMKENIKYGWIDIYNKKHINNLQNFRRLYRTSSIEEILETKLGTCIEQVWLMKQLLNKINIPSKMFCTRIYEDNDYNKMDESEHMHCFILYYINNKVYHIEHPNSYKIGIHEYQSEEDAVNEIKEYYNKLSNGVFRPITEFYNVETNLTFKEFNNYINGLDNKHSINI